MTKSKKQKERQRILDALSEKVELSNDKGKYVGSRGPLTRKDRKHSGRHTPQIATKGKLSEMIANAEEPQEEYDDWVEHRDGLRGDLDRTKLRKKGGSFWQDPEEIEKINERVKKKLEIRKAMKGGLNKK